MPIGYVPVACLAQVWSKGRPVEPSGAFSTRVTFTVKRTSIYLFSVWEGPGSGGALVGVSTGVPPLLHKQAPDSEEVGAHPHRHAGGLLPPRARRHHHVRCRRGDERRRGLPCRSVRVRLLDFLYGQTARLTALDVHS